MDWDIISFVGAGPLRFGMTPAEVASIVGSPDQIRQGIRSTREARSKCLPMLYYRSGVLSEIEFYREVENVRFEEIQFFVDDGLECLRYLEARTGGAVVNVGAVLFQNLGLTTGRLDEAFVEAHTVTAFQKGLWDDKVVKFDRISFQ